MSIDGLVTFVGLVVALFALATDARRKALLLRRRMTFALTAGFGLAVLYLELFSVLAPECPFEGGLCRLLVLDAPDAWISPTQLAFLLVLAWLALVFWNLQRTALKARHLPRLQALTIALAEEKRYSELCKVVGPHLDLITKTASAKDNPPEDLVDAALSVQRLLYRRRELVQFIALERPALATAMMAEKQQIVFDFTDQLLTHLISRSESVLYDEIADCQNLTDDGGYFIPDRNVYLHFLFGDPTQANRLGAWRPVMEHTLTVLSEANGQPYQVFLNSPSERFDAMKWSDPTYLSIHYLTLMVDAAMRKGVAWHMWLFYLPLVVKRLLALYADPRKDQEVFEEWPTRNAYLLAEIFDALVFWINAVNQLPDDSPHLQIKNERVDSENGNIPKSAILALGDCLQQVLTCDAVSDKVKDGLAELAFRCVDALPRTGPRSAFRRVLIASLKAGGTAIRPQHEERLRRAFGEVDHVVRGRLDDVESVLPALWPPEPTEPAPPAA